MIRMFRVLRKTLLFVLCLGMVFSVAAMGCRNTKAAAAFTMTKSEVSAEGKFTVSVTIPSVSWNTFNFNVTYDHTVVQAGDATATGGIMVVPNAQLGNTTGTYKVSGVSIMPATADVVLTIPFTVTNKAAKSVSVSLSISDFAAGPNQLEYTLPTALTVPLPGAASEPTPPPVSSSTDTPTPPVSTTTDTPASTGNTSTSTTTATAKPPVTSSATTVKPSSNPTSTKSETSDTGTQSDTTDSEALTDTETNFPISDTSTDPETDVTDTNVETSSNPLVSTTITASTDCNKKICFTPLTLALISGGIALLFCGGLTAIGLLRRKKD